MTLYRHSDERAECRRSYRQGLWWLALAAAAGEDFTFDEDVHFVSDFALAHEFRAWRHVSGAHTGRQLWSTLLILL